MPMPATVHVKPTSSPLQAHLKPPASGPGRTKAAAMVMAKADAFAKKIGPLIYDMITSGATPLHSGEGPHRSGLSYRSLC